MAPLLNKTLPFVYYITYCHPNFSDLIEGLVLLMQSNYTDPVNLGNPDEYTILDFAENILKSVG